LIYGEALFDTFPDGVSILGGAPFNVAWHLRGFELDPLFVSRVGNDEAGKKVFQAMESWGMDTRGVQVDSVYPTGSVNVSLQHGQPSFAIKTQQAYDFIDLNEVISAVGQSKISLLYHGTLIGRTHSSFVTLQALINAVYAPVFMDINLRSRCWNVQNVTQLMGTASWIKLNQEELVKVDGCGNLETVVEQKAAQKVRDRYGLDFLLVTRGAEGAFLINEKETFFAAPSQVTELVDTVGAGDAFTSVVIMGLCQGWALPLTLHRAAEFASSVCCIQGAIFSDRKLYERYLTQWEETNNE
jgi:fructokinase